MEIRSFSGFGSVPPVAGLGKTKGKRSAQIPAKRNLDVRDLSTAIGPVFLSCCEEF